MSYYRGKNHIHRRHLNTLPDWENYSIPVPYELSPPSWPRCGTCVCLDNSNSDARTGSPPQGYNDDERRTPPDLRSPPSVQVGAVPRTSRSVSSTRTTAPSQAQPIGPYGVGQNWECKQCHWQQLVSAHFDANGIARICQLTRVMSHLHLLNHTWVPMVNMVVLLFKTGHTLSLWNNVSNRLTTHHRTHPNTIELVTQCHNRSLCHTMNRTLFIPRMPNTHNLRPNPANNHGACNSRLPNICNSRLGGRQLRIRRRSSLHPLSIRTKSNRFPISHIRTKSNLCPTSHIRTKSNLCPISHIRTKSNLFPITHHSCSPLPDTQGVALGAVLQASRFPSTSQGSIFRPTPHRLHQ